MSRLFVVTILFMIRLSVAAQDSFRTNYGGNGFDRGMYITPTRDKGHIVCGYSNSFGDNYDMYVVKVDPVGKQQWHKNYGRSKMEVGWSITELSNTGYLLHGSTTRDSTRDDILLIRLDTAGNVMWEKTYGNRQYERTTQLIETADKKYLLIGQRNIDSTNIDSYILKIDTSGNLLWEKTFGGPRMERTYYGAETMSGDFLISGSILPYQNNKADILLMRITADGELKWMKTIGEENVHEIAHSFGRNRDKNSFTLTGYIESSQPGFHDGLFMQLDENGNILNQSRHHTGEDLRLMHTEATSDGGFVSTGFSRKDITKDNHDAVLLKLDNNGKSLWMKTFGTPEKDDQGYWVLTSKDGGFILTGYTHSSGNNGDLWIIKTNAEGN